MPPLIFPRLSTAAALQLIIEQVLTLRLYSNAHAVDVSDDVTAYVEVVGGGYAAAVLTEPNWTISPGSPSVALYNAFQDFVFVAAPPVTTVYGYYVTNPDNLVVYAEQFNPALTPQVIPAIGTTIQIRPRFGADNLIFAAPAVP